jgi:hypothetical protein
MYRGATRQNTTLRLKVMSLMDYFKFHVAPNTTPDVTMLRIPLGSLR